MKTVEITNEIFEHCRKTEEAERQFAIIHPRLTWGMLVGLEPDLENLLSEARNADSGGDHFCGQVYWHQELKPQMLPLVGHCRPDFHPILGTSAAYDLAYDYISEAVSRCRGCSCCE